MEYKDKMYHWMFCGEPEGPPIHVYGPYLMEFSHLEIEGLVLHADMYDCNHTHVMFPCTPSALVSKPGFLSIPISLSIHHDWETYENAGFTYQHRAEQHIVFDWITDCLVRQRSIRAEIQA